MNGPLERDPAPDVSLVDMASGRASLSSYWRREPAVVVFLRYFGCPFCQAQVVSLSEESTLFDQAGAGIVLIGQGAPSDAREFTDRMSHPFECLVDPDRAAYRAYGLVRARPSQIITPSAGLPFVRANLHRATRQRGMHGGAFLQMPGTFVIDTEGIVRMAHRNRHIADTPSNGRILEVLAGLEDRSPRP